MSVLRNLESKLAGLVEGTFSRAFKSEVRPVELARKLAREMEEHKVVSLSRTYVPNEYAVWLSVEDREHVGGLRGRAAARAVGLPAGARAARAARAAHAAGDRLQDGRAAAPGRVRHPGPARRGPTRTRPAARARPRRGTRWSTRRPSACPSRCASRTRAAPPRACGSTAARRCSAPRAPRSGARASATSSWTTPTCPAATPRSAPPAARGSCATSGPPTASRSTAAASSPPAPQSLAPGDVDRDGHLARRLRPGVAAAVLDPVAVALKFGFLAVLYLFLLWTVRSAWRDLRRNAAVGAPGVARDDATGLHVASRGIESADGGAPAAARRHGRGPAVRRRLRPVGRARCSGAATRPTSCSRTPSPPPATRGSSRTAT